MKLAVGIKKDTVWEVSAMVSRWDEYVCTQVVSEEGMA